MESPEREIEGVIRALTQGSPTEQESTLNRYFQPNASFSHPFCYVPSFSKGSVPFFKSLDSLWVILAIYRWYRTLSPHIDIEFDSIAFNQSQGILYVSLRQTFAVWFIPFYKAPVRLVSVLHLTQEARPLLDEGDASVEAKNGIFPDNLATTNPAYYIAKQEDLYQVTDCVQFLLPRLGPIIWFMWQLFSTCLCVIGSLFFMPLYILLNKG